jgi:hypothetical protein
MDRTGRYRRVHRQPWSRFARLRQRASLSARKRHVEPWATTNEALSALTRAWVVAVIATMLLAAALAVAPLWDRAVYMQALRDSLNTDPQMMQPVDMAPADPRRIANGG